MGLEGWAEKRGQVFDVYMLPAKIYRRRKHDLEQVADVRTKTRCDMGSDGVSNATYTAGMEVARCLLS